jgi:3-dehydroquinate synthase
MPQEDRDHLAVLIRQMGPLPAVADLPVSQVLEAIGRDKKVIAGRLHFVLPGPIGSCEVAGDVTEDEIRAALRDVGLKG